MVEMVRWSTMFPSGGISKQVLLKQDFETKLPGNNVLSYLERTRRITYISRMISS